MKKITSIKTASGLALALVASNGFAGTITKVLEPVNVTIALTQKEGVPNVPDSTVKDGVLTLVKDEGGKPVLVSSAYTKVQKSGTGDKAVTTYTWKEEVKTKTTKIGNKEILQAIVPEGAVTGWSIKALPVFGAASAGEEGELPSSGWVYSVYATKGTGESAEKIDLFEASVSNQVKATGAGGHSENADGEEIAVAKTTGDYSFEGLSSFTIAERTYSAVFAVSAKPENYIPDSTKSKINEDIAVPGASKLSGVIGENADGAILTGNISFEKAKAKSVTLEMPAAE